MKADFTAEGPVRPSDPSVWPGGASVSLDALKGDGIDIGAFRQAGIHCVELAWRNDVIDLLDPVNERLVESFVGKIREMGMEVWTMHLPYGPEWDVSAVDSAASGAAIGRHIRLLNLANRWNIRNAVLHPSWEPIGDKERPARRAACKRSLSALAEEAERLQVRIAVECLPRTCLGNTSGEMTELVGADDRLGVCCDVNHLVRETPQHFIRRLGPRIVTVHMSDNDGTDEKHWLPGKGVIDWNEVIGALAENGYRGPFLFEVRKPDPYELTACWRRLLHDYDRDGHK